MLKTLYGVKCGLKRRAVIILRIQILEGFSQARLRIQREVYLLVSRPKVINVQILI